MSASVMTNTQRELLGIWASWETDDQGRIWFYGRQAQRSVDALVGFGYLRDHHQQKDEHEGREGCWSLYEVTDAGRAVLR